MQTAKANKPLSIENVSNAETAFAIRLDTFRSIFVEISDIANTKLFLFTGKSHFRRIGSGARDMKITIKCLFIISIYKSLCKSWAPST